MRGNTFEWRNREQGSRDWRLLPATLCGWAASLAAHAGFDYCVEQEGRLGILPLVLVLSVPLLALLGLLGLPFMRSPILRLPVGVRRAVAARHFSIIVCVVAAMACASSALTYDVFAMEGCGLVRGQKRRKRRCDTGTYDIPRSEFEQACE